MKSKSSSLCFLLAILSLILVYTPSFATEPNYGTATVDGNYAEWNLAADFFAEMHRAFDPEKPLESNLYLRYDCTSNTMYALVLTTPDTLPALLEPGNAWIAIDGISNKVVTGSSGNDGVPPDFAWVEIGFDGDPTHVRGYEASFSLPESSYKLIGHVQVLDSGSSQTSGTDRKDDPDGIGLTINCPPIGACCLPDGSCVETTSEGCTGQGGTYMGDETLCSEVTCETPPPSGACCLPDGSCVETTSEGCAQIGGLYEGDGTDCATVVCEIVIQTCEYCVVGLEGVYVDPNLWIDGTIAGNASIVILGGGNLVDVMGGGDASFGVNQLVAGNLVHNGEVSIGGGSDIQGNVDSGASIVIGTTVQIMGNVTAAGPVSLGGDTYVYGILTEFGTPLSFNELPCPPETAFSAGGPSIKQYNGKTTTLGPGVYGNLELGSLNKLYLSSGDYYFDSIKVLNSPKLYLDLTSGPINIYVVGDVYFGTNMDVFLTGGTAADMYLETHGMFQMLGGSDWYGRIFAPFGNIEIAGGNNNITGTLWSCKNVILDDSITIHCLPCP